MKGLVEYLFEDKTEIQERFTCFVFNNYRDRLQDLKLEDLPKEVQDNKWLNSFKAQVECMNEYVADKGWTNPVAAYYSKEDPVSGAIIDLGKKLAKEVTPKRNRNAIDPTDVIMYSAPAKQEIVSTITDLLNSGKEGNALLADSIKAIQELIKANKYVGISLKKGTRFEYEEKNLSPDIEMFSNPEIEKISKSERGITIAFTTADGVSGNANIRTSQRGSDRIRFLPTIAGDAQVGDCPAFVYKSVLKDDAVKKIQELEKGNAISNKWSPSSMSNIKEFFITPRTVENTVDNQVYNVLHFILTNGPDKFREMLLWSEKMTDECIPYLLIAPK